MSSVLKTLFMEYCVKKFLSAVAVSAAALVATPAAAAPTGGRVEAIVGYDILSAGGEDEAGVLYGVGAGYDFAVGTSVSLGLDVEATDATTDVDIVKASRDLYVGGRLTTAISDKANLYFKAGYTNARFKADGFGGENADGVRGGVGLQYNVGGKAYVGGEYRYSNYEADLSRHQLALTIGTRF